MGGLNQFSAGLTDVGRKRSSNEDSILLLPDLGLYCVADGMGGVRGGEYASQKTLAVVGEAAIREGKGRDIGGRMGVIRAAVNEASAAIKAWADDKGIQGTGTTLVVLLVDPVTRRGAVLHAGDSRAYRFRSGKLEPLTKDHSVVSALGIEGGQPLSSMFQNLITRAVGLNPVVELDVGEVLIEPGDVYLLCSDGLTKMVPDAEVVGLLSLGAGRRDLKPCAQALVDAANAHGGEDNASVVLVRCVEEGAAVGGAGEPGADTGGRRRTADRPSAEDAEIVGVTPKSDEPRDAGATPFTPSTPRDRVPPVSTDPRGARAAAAAEATRSTAGTTPHHALPRPSRLGPAARRAVVLAAVLLSGAIMGGLATAAKSGRLGCATRPGGTEVGTGSTAPSPATSAPLPPSPLPDVTTSTSAPPPLPPATVATTPAAVATLPTTTAPRPPPATPATTQPPVAPAPTQPLPTTTTRPPPTTTTTQSPPPTTTTQPPKRWSADDVRVGVQAALKDGDWGRLGSELARGADWRASVDEAGLGRVFRAWRGEWGKHEGSAAGTEAALNDLAAAMNALGAQIGAEAWHPGSVPWPTEPSERATRFCRGAYALQLHFLAAFSRFSQRQRESVAPFGAGGEALLALWSLNKTAKADREKVAASLGGLPGVLEGLERWVQSSRQLPLAPEDAERAVQAYATEARRTADHAWRHVLDGILAVPLDALRAASPKGGEKAKAIEAAIAARAQLFQVGVSVSDVTRWRAAVDPQDVAALLRLLKDLDAMDARAADGAP
jgi:serine/threonine protein phosphatase PrpC